MQIKLKSMTLENFKGCASRHIDFSDITNIYGANASGKSTIADAWNWLLFDKDSTGNTKFQVRPLNADGTQVDNVEIKVFAELTIDGRYVSIQKLQKQKWVKPRGRQEKELQGNINEYEINDIPKTERDFKAYIATLIDETIFKLVTSPVSFVTMKWQEQRKVLMKLVSEITDADVIAANPELIDLSDKLENFTIEELTAKAKKALSEFKKRQVELPARIDEVKKSIVDIDTAELELQANSLKEQIAAEEKKLEDTEAIIREWDKQTNGVLEKKMEINEYVRKVNADLVRLKNNLNTEIADLEQKINDAKRTFTRAESRKTQHQDALHEANERRELVLADWKAENAKAFNESEWAFDESSLTCPMCGQELPEADKEKRRAEFETKKAEAREKFNAGKKSKLDWINKLGESAQTQIKAASAGINEESEKMTEAKLEIGKLNSLLASVQEKLASSAESVDLSGDEVYQKLKSELASMETAHASQTNVSEIRNSINASISDKRNELLEVQSQIASADNSKAEGRVEELTAELKATGQKIADCEKELFELDAFVKTKMELLSTKINSKFSVVNWKLFNLQVNGGIAETCECTVNGVPYSNVNSAGKMQAGLDIIKTLSGIYDVSVPIWLDNRESVTDIPEMDAQIINLIVSPADKELRIEEAEFASTPV